MTKTVSARIPNKSHEELVERCNKSGCTINEWLNAAVEYLFTHSSDFDFGDEEEDETIDSSPKIEINDESKPAPVTSVRIIES